MLDYFFASFVFEKYFYFIKMYDQRVKFRNYKKMRQMQKKGQFQNFPSIENISPKKQSQTTLSTDDMYRLFTTKQLPKFQLIELKIHPVFQKNAIANILLFRLENWNRRVQQKNILLNYRTELFCNQFIHTSLRRIALLSNQNIDEELNDLYKWYEKNSKADELRNFSMPKKNKNYEDQWEVRKTFKSNTALQINSYKRKFLSPGGEQNNFLLSGNFITCPKMMPKQEKARKNFDTTHNQNVYYKIKQEQIRRMREIKEIKQKQIQWKDKRARFREQSMKNYYQGTFDTTIRFIRSSNGDRVTNKQFEDIKLARVKSSLGKKKLQIKTHPSIKENKMVPSNIGGLNLIKNPLEIKKKKVGKSKN